MSENKKAEMHQGLDPMAVLPGHEGRKAEVVEPLTKNLNKVDETIDGQSYFLGEVPQSHLVDPCAFLPRNSRSVEI